jgi:alpha-glucoside transport system substrate-binding protein
MCPRTSRMRAMKFPQTMEELKALTDQIVADGGTPWCIGLGSGGATGWPATDWVEDMMLRTAVARDLRQVGHERDPVQRSRRCQRDRRIRLVRQERQVCRWRRAAVASTDFRDSPKGLFASPPKCYLHHQASFIPSFFPEGTEARRGCRLLLHARPMPASRSRQAGARRRHARDDHQGQRRPRAPSSSS